MSITESENLIRLERLKLLHDLAIIEQEKKLNKAIKGNVSTAKIARNKFVGLLRGDLNLLNKQRIEIIEELQAYRGKLFRANESSGSQDKVEGHQIDENPNCKDSGSGLKVIEEQPEEEEQDNLSNKGPSNREQSDEDKTKNSDLGSGKIGFAERVSDSETSNANSLSATLNVDCDINDYAIDGTLTF